MTTAIIGTGGLGSAAARRLASGGENLRISSADIESARKLAADIGGAVVVAADNSDVLVGADAVILALRFTVLKSVIDEIAGPLSDQVVVVPSNPVGLDAQGNVVHLLPKGQSSGEVVAGGYRRGRTWPWHSAACRPTCSSRRVTARPSRRSSSTPLTTTLPPRKSNGEIRTAGFEPVKVGGVEQSTRLEVDGDLHDLVIGPTEARSLTSGA